MKSDDPLLGLADAAKRLRCGHTYLRHLLITGRLQGVRYGRLWHVERDVLDEFIKAHRTMPARRQTDAVAVPRGKGGR